MSRSALVRCYLKRLRRVDGRTLVHPRLCTFGATGCRTALGGRRTSRFSPLPTSHAWFCFARLGGEVPPLLVGEEDGHVTDSCGDADGNGDTDVKTAEEAVHKQGDTRAGNDAI